MKSKFELFFKKMSHKAVEKTCNINNVFGPGTANECTVQWWFKKFCKGDKSLEDGECSGWPLEIDKDQLRAIIEADSLTATRQVTKNSMSAMLGHSAFEENWKCVKAQ